MSTQNPQVINASGPASAERLAAAIDALLKVLGSLEYGSIELTFHQGRLVQVEKREKTRLSAGSP